MEAGTQDLAWGTDKLGDWIDPVEFEVSRERIAAYAAATNDEHPAHLAGDYAPPVFSVVPAFQAAATAIGGTIPPELLMRIVHAEQDFRFHRAIEPGMKLTTRSAPIGIHGRSSGVIVAGRSETRDDGGELVGEQWMSCFVRGAELAESAGEEFPGHGFPEELRAAGPAATVTHSYDADQTKRYSEASGDPMPIHLDEEFARNAGLPGIIVHGLCTMAFAGRAVIGEFCPDDPRRLKRLAVRFSSIVQPHEQVTHELYDAGGGEIHFETLTGEGKPAIKEGLAEVSG